jgi:hypothetical protein
LPGRAARRLARARKPTLLALACDRIEVTGGIRRRLPEVDALELVCIPRLGEPVPLPVFRVLEMTTVMVITRPA